MKNVVNFLTKQLTAEGPNLIVTEDGKKLYFLEVGFFTNTLEDFFAAFPEAQSEPSQRSLAKKIFANRREKNLYGILIDPENGEIIWSLRQVFFRREKDELIIKEAREVLVELADQFISEQVSPVVSFIKGRAR